MDDRLLMFECLKLTLIPLLLLFYIQNLTWKQLFLGYISYTKKIKYILYWKS